VRTSHTSLIPQAPEAEWALVSAFVDPANSRYLGLARQLLKVRDFHDPANAKMFAAECAVADAGLPVDKVSIVEELRRTGNLEAVGGAQNVTINFDLIVDEPRIRQWATSIREAAWKRHIHKAAVRLSRVALNGETADEGLAQFQTDIAGLISQGQASGLGTAESRVRLINFDELEAMPEEDYDYLVDGLLVAGGTSLVVAKPKVGKSVTLQNLAFAIAHGEPFLGRRTRQGLVIYIALEDKPANIRHNLRKMGVRNGGNLLFWIGRSPENAIQWLRETLREYKPSLIIVDPVQRLLHLSDTNDYAQVSNATEPLIDLARRSGAHLALAHHAGKGDDYLGSTAFFGAVDTLLRLRKRSDGTRSARSEQRYGDDLEETVIELDRATTLIVPRGTIVAVEREEVSQKIIEILTTAGHWVKHAEIAESIEARRELIGTALCDLASSNRIQRVGSGKKGSPFQYATPGMPVPEQDVRPQAESIVPHIPNPEQCGFPIPDLCTESKDTIQEMSLESDGIVDHSIPLVPALHASSAHGERPPRDLKDGAQTPSGP